MITSHIDSALTAPGGRITLELINIGKRFTFQGKADRAHLAFGQSDFWALKEVSFSALEGEVLGIIGRNGAGKTTCLNIIAGVLSPTEGAVRVGGKVLGLFNLGVGFQDELSGRENIFLNGAILGAERKEIEGRVDPIVEFSELGKFIDMPLGSYSQGMRLRLAFSIMANLDFDLLVIDEALAVGDMLFQNKCFQRLMDFKRQGKTLIFTSQSMEVIERFCDKVILLEHGRIIFQGGAKDGVTAYLELVSSDKFFVGPATQEIPFYEETKKWADNKDTWGEKLGTKEVVIEKVEFFNSYGAHAAAIKSGEALKIKVCFRAQNPVTEIHFGVAFFRQDGVYCYGPNTAFDGCTIAYLSKGTGWFMIDYPHILLAPNEYYFSVALWDKNEIISFDYHNACYKIKILGKNRWNELLRLPYGIKPRLFFKRVFGSVRMKTVSSSELQEMQGKEIEDQQVQLGSVQIKNDQGEQKAAFLTQESLVVAFRFLKTKISQGDASLWVGLYRSDAVLCQAFPIAFIPGKEVYEIIFPRMALLPGSYYFSCGIWLEKTGRFLMFKDRACLLKMIFTQKDHGTVFLEHRWRWELNT